MFFLIKKTSVTIFGKKHQKHAPEVSAIYVLTPDFHSVQSGVKKIEPYRLRFFAINKNFCQSFWLKSIKNIR